MKKQTRIITAMLMCLTILLGITTIAIAEEAPIKVLLNGTEIAFDQPPIIEEGRTLVPMRAIFEAMGATVDWNGDTRTVTGTKDDIVVMMQIGNNVITKNGQEIMLDVPPQIVNDRTLVPVRAVAESFNAQVDWNGETRTVIIAAEEAKAVAEVFFSAPLLNHEYGPFKVVHNSISVIDSIVFTEIAYNGKGGSYDHTGKVNIKGISNSGWFQLFFYCYDSNNNQLGSVNISGEVKSDQPFERSFDFGMQGEMLKNTARIEFYKAVYDDLTFTVHPMYEKHYKVPDFGAIFNVPLNSTDSVSSKTWSYDYKDSEITKNNPGDTVYSVIEKYTTILQENGFYKTTTFVDGKAHVYYSDGVHAITIYSNLEPYFEYDRTHIIESKKPEAKTVILIGEIY